MVGQVPIRDVQNIVEEEVPGPKELEKLIVILIGCNRCNWTPLNEVKGGTLGARKETRILRRAIVVVNQATSRESVD